MAEHLYEASLAKTTSTAAAHIATIVPGTLGAGIRMPEIREIGVFVVTPPSSGGAEIGIGVPAVAGVTASTSETVQALNQLDPAGHTSLVTAFSGTQPTAPSNFYRRAELQGIAGAGVIFTWAPGEFMLWSGASVPQVVVWQLGSLAVTYDVYLKVAE